jgi:hypothetical protein
VSSCKDTATPAFCADVSAIPCGIPKTVFSNDGRRSLFCTQAGGGGLRTDHLFSTTSINSRTRVDAGCQNYRIDRRCAIVCLDIHFHRKRFKRHLPSPNRVHKKPDNTCSVHYSAPHPPASTLPEQALPKRNSIGRDLPPELGKVSSPATVPGMLEHVSQTLSLLAQHAPDMEAIGLPVQTHIEEGRKIFAAPQAADSAQERARSADMPAAVAAFCAKKGELCSMLKVINNAGQEHFANNPAEAGKFNMSILHRYTPPVAEPASLAPPRQPQPRSRHLKEPSPRTREIPCARPRRLSYTQRIRDLCRQAARSALLNCWRGPKNA